MSKRDAELIASVRQALAAHNRRDFDAATKNVHPEFELVLPGDKSPLKGAARFRAWMEPDALFQVYEPLEFRVVGNKVLVRTLNHLRGVGSSFEDDYPTWAVYAFDEAGLCIRLEIYLQHQEAQALKAVGLSE
jgi:ketosteroid isomerase-like protein